MTDQSKLGKFFEKAAALLGEGGLSRSQEDLTHFGKDWSGLLEPSPCAIAFPRTTQQVAELLKLCSEHRVSVVPSGGRTGLSGGACAATGELVLSLAKMNRMGEVDVASRTVRVQAGAVTQAVHQHCEPHGLTWPVDFASKGSSQVGGNLSTNAGGVRVIRYGNARNWVMAVQAVTMQGEVLELNGDLEKNNTGYDLRNLLIGAEGTLAVITEATLKLAPPPSQTQVFFFGVESMSKVIELFKAARSGPFEVSAFECLSQACYKQSVEFFRITPPVSAEGCGVFVLLEIENPLGELDPWLEKLYESGLIREGTLAQSPKEAETLWKIREGVAEAVMAGSTVHQHDVSVPIARLQQFADGIEAQYRRDYPRFEVFIFGHIGDGNLHIFIRKPETMTTDEFIAECKKSDDDLFRTIQGLRGSISAEHGIGVLKRAALPYSRSPLEITILRGLKKAFDPLNLLNPGKLL